MSQLADIKRKIRRLLALAQSKNENEARAALLKARELMAKYKLRDAELEEAEKQDVKRVLTDITCSKRRDPWIVRLAAVIGEKHCCRSYRICKRGQQTQTIGFIGFENDIEICTIIFRYATDCIVSEIKRIKKEYRSYPNNYVKNLCASYGYGFTAGIQNAFNEQEDKNKNEWGLVLATPKAVEDACKDLRYKEFTARIQDELTPSYYTKGYTEGKQFDPGRRLTKQAKAQ